MSNDTVNTSYTGKRRDILNLIPDTVSRVLDVGCSNGQLCRQIKEKYKTEVVGIEINKALAESGRDYFNHIIVKDVEKISITEVGLPAGYFDCIIFADILEHLRDPWKTLKMIKYFLSEDGLIIASIPNVRHYSTIYNLLIKAYWPYRDRGIHDINHLRFFTKKNIVELFEIADLTVDEITSNYRIYRSGSYINVFYHKLPLHPLKHFMTYQYLIKARHSSHKNHSI